MKNNQFLKFPSALYTVQNKTPISNYILFLPDCKFGYLPLNDLNNFALLFWLAWPVFKTYLWLKWAFENSEERFNAPQCTCSIETIIASFVDEWSYKAWEHDLYQFLKPFCTKFIARWWMTYGNIKVWYKMLFGQKVRSIWNWGRKYWASLTLWAPVTPICWNIHINLWQLLCSFQLNYIVPFSIKKIHSSISKIVSFMF